MTDTISTADVSATENDALNTDTDIAAAFLAHAGITPDEDASKKKKPSEEGKVETEEVSEEQADPETDDDTETSDESPDDKEGEGDEETEETEEDAKARKFVDIDDNTFVKIKVGDEEIEVPVKDLTRIHGQEASLTRKSQEVAEQRKRADGEIAKTAAVLDVMLKRAREAAAPFAKIDFLALTKDPNVSAEELTSLRELAQERFDNVRFLEGETGNFLSAIQQQQKVDSAKEASECVKALATPGTDDKPNPYHIEGWSNKVYDDLRQFAVETGLSKDVVNELRDPAAFKLIHMAYQFKKGASKVNTTKVNKTPKKIVKTSQSPVATKQSPNKAKQQKAMDVLKRQQTQEAGAEAFLSRMVATSDDE